MVIYEPIISPHTKPISRKTLLKLKKFLDENDRSKYKKDTKSKIKDCISAIKGMYISCEKGEITYLFFLQQLVPTIYYFLSGKAERDYKLL